MPWFWKKHVKQVGVSMGKECDAWVMWAWLLLGFDVKKACGGLLVQMDSDSESAPGLQEAPTTLMNVVSEWYP